MSKITDAITALAEPIVLKNDCELWDVEYIKEVGGWVLRIYIDRPEGISIDHCEAVSRELDPMLDENEDIIPGTYTFEVSSAGAERQLKRPSDFERFLGHLVEIKLYKPRDGQKVFLGELKHYLPGGTIEIEAAGQLHTFEKAEIANARLRIA
ncbi:MAG: ribosome maturation factor RimP [Oscillospiraceae bacterium]|nr:ribosome maturation factor RimP [Oscillospiraceae bacterium]